MARQINSNKSAFSYLRWQRATAALPASAAAIDRYLVTIARQAHSRKHAAAGLLLWVNCCCLQLIFA